MKNEKLENLILSFAANKSELDSYKKITDRENAQIKAIMLELNLPSYEVGNYKATCVVSKRETMNEDILLSLFSSVPAFVALADKYDIIKQRPYIDYDVLEKAIYDGNIPDAQLLEMDKAKQSKEVVTLKVTYIKKKKEEN